MTLHAPVGQRRIFAHRGLSSRYPENTLASFKAAADAGALWAELDVDIMGDGTLLVCHDSTLDRTTNRSGGYYDLGASDLETIDAGSWFDPAFAGEKMPTLAQVIDLANERKLGLNIEIKQHETGAAGAMRLLEGVAEQATRLENGLIISSFGLVMLSKLHEIAPELPLACLWETVALYDDWRSVMELVGASYIHPEDTGLTAGKVKAWRDAGYEVNVWTVNSPDRANQLFNWGVNGIFTDYADRFPASN